MLARAKSLPPWRCASDSRKSANCCRSLRLALCLAGVLCVPAADRVIVRSAVLLALEIEARNRAEDLLPVAGVATDLDLRLDGSEGVECLIQQIAHDTGLRLITSRAHVT